MIILFWVLFIAFLLLIIYFILMIFKMNSDKINKRWDRVITHNLEIKKIQINDSEGNLINCYLYTSSDFLDSNKMPGVIILPRRDKKYPFFEHWGAHFALQGYPTLCVELYNKKLSRAEFIKKNRKIMPRIKQLLWQNDRVDKNNLIYFGIDYGAEIVLLEGLIDEDVKIICGISLYLIDKNKIEKRNNSDKVYLAHCKDDKIVPFSDFEKNRDLLALKKNNLLILDFGGHYLLSMEHSVAAFFSIKIKQKLNPKYKQIERKKIYEK